jgi:hypothetical protein
MTSLMNPTFHPADPARFAAALRRFDETNAQDPNTLQVEGAGQPRELVYSRWLSEWVLRLQPDASEALRLAAHSQHICRWEIPRESYPLTRAGYLKWRADLKQFHARNAGEILREVGYPETVIARVQALNLKKNFPQDAEVRVLEDALCLVFLEHQFAELARKATDEKVINALRKSWEKMTPQARELAQGLTFGEKEKALLEKALAGGK